jgi:hypothetical protein
MNQTTTKLKVYYFWYADPKLENPASIRVVGSDYKAMAADRAEKTKAGYDCGFIYHHNEKVVKFAK